jgi:hypothetical protein
MGPIKYARVGLSLPRPILQEGKRQIVPAKKEKLRSHATRSIAEADQG